MAPDPKDVAHPSLVVEIHCANQSLANGVVAAPCVRAIGRPEESLRGGVAEPAHWFPLPLRRSVTHPGKSDQWRLSAERKIAQRSSRQVTGTHPFARVALHACDTRRLVDRDG